MFYEKAVVCAQVILYYSHLFCLEDDLFMVTTKKLPFIMGICKSRIHWIHSIHWIHRTQYGWVYYFTSKNYLIPVFQRPTMPAYIATRLSVISPQNCRKSPKLVILKCWIQTQIEECFVLSLLSYRILSNIYLAFRWGHSVIFRLMRFGP